jgi:hypothetical protein
MLVKKNLFFKNKKSNRVLKYFIVYFMFIKKYNE